MQDDVCPQGKDDREGPDVKTRVVVAGIGGRGSWAARKLAQDEHYELVGMCERNLGKLEHFRRREGLEHVTGFGSITECLDRQDVDAGGERREYLI